MSSPVSPINQNRSFNERLSDFGPELGPFLSSVWNDRANLNLQEANTGISQLYARYSGVENRVAYDDGEMDLFLKSLTHLAGTYKVSCQKARKYLTDIQDSDLPILWTDFFHVLAGGEKKTNRFRVYAHASSWRASMEIMTAIVATYGKLGISEVKTCGPGSLRLDTIVAYLYDEDSQTKLVGIVSNLDPSYFTDSLPALVKRVGAGIGTADNPAKIAVIKERGTRFSFGSFYCTLIWLALKTTPNVIQPNAEARHFLDNLLFSMRALKIEPSNPQSFPAAAELEAWYKKSVAKQ